MKHYYVVTNPEKDRDGSVTARVRNCITALGGICQVAKSAPDGNGTWRYTDGTQVDPEVECVLVIGGDGTLIQAARDLKDLELPIMGINRGTLGFLSEVEESEIEETIQCLFEGKFYVEERMMLRGELYRGDDLLLRDHALNDIILSRQGVMRILRYQITVNGQLLQEYDADGVLVATPTGSTAYNLSAGGPIVSPEASLFVVTPVCAHALNARSIVLPEDSDIWIEAFDVHGAEDGWLAAFDGASYKDVRSGDRLHITKSDRKVRLVKLSRVSFLETLRQKMQEHGK